ncbi:DISARM system helicase DrmA [Aquabacter sp. L1I39]|uniref:DISARM system helicase DrmA n=1 Tax=Aquabacter sp. L1I39 TaxID=2820278 RepID=UPI001AD9662F|nr:DISARM system helicase DrmA [Aquabacter sp. L1I39]QTL04816.1 DISARM system helicase DrmA [Aquabacter sp. L1I39]
MKTSEEVRAQIVNVFRRDLIGPGPQDADLATERLNENPARWYLAGFIAPAEDPLGLEGDDDDVDPSAQEEMELDVEEPDADGSNGAAADNEEPDAPVTRRRFLPSSIGLTVLLDPDVTEIEARVSWGDYRTEPRLPEEVLLPEPKAEEVDGDGKKMRVERPMVDWVRSPKERVVALPVTEGRGASIVVPESAAEQRRGGGLVLETHSRLFSYETPDGQIERVRALTVFLVNRRATVHRFYSDVSYAFQARLELVSESCFRPRRDLSGYRAPDWDLRVADLHYRDLNEWAVGRNAAAGWEAAEGIGQLVKRVWTDPLPSAEVERVAPNEDADLKARVSFGMEALAQLAEGDGVGLRSALADLPGLYGAWINAERAKLGRLPTRRKETGERLIADMEKAKARIAAGIDLLAKDAKARTAFRFMNLSVAMAARRRVAGPTGDPAALPEPQWRPFQLAFVLLNLAGLVDRRHVDRETADLLFFPTGGGKTEAYLGLAALVIAHRRLGGPGVLGAGVAVIMRYTLRLLTLDQLARAAGVVCALELMRTNAKNVDDKGRRMLGDWPIEIGLWVGSDASPNKLGGKGNTDETTAVGRVRRYKSGRDKRAPAPLKACPWCGTEFKPDSFSCFPNMHAPTNLEIRCVNTSCDFSRNRPLPVLTVDEPIYRRLPAFLIATVDKFAALPWVGETGAFFGHVDRFQPDVGFYGAAEPGLGSPLGNGWSLDPPDLIIQDELHLIAGPLGTVAGLYEAAIDQLASRGSGETRIRPKIVASTATVRRAADQISALFDRSNTSIFPPPGVDRVDSFFARTVPSSTNAARLYLGIAAQGRGPKLVFLRSLTTLVAAAQAAYDANLTADPKNRNPADPFMTALCYFNALRELGGARRIVEDEVRDRAARYGAQRRRVDPADNPFADRHIKEPMELTSRVSTDEVAKAKQRLEAEFGSDVDTVDVALATNMISVGLDITRLGLMVVQGQPKTTAEYIQATSRVGRDHNRPGIVLAVLNLHKPRDRMHFEQFGQFHRTFYRAVEATSVTPWAARALDRALAAVVVAAARHVDGALTPDLAVSELKNNVGIRNLVRDSIVERAPERMIAGGRAALSKLIDDILNAWIETSDDQAAGGSAFAYAKKKSPHRLLHMPLEPEIANLAEPHRRFVAGRSMRDVEPNVTLKVKDPLGNPIANAEDLA